MNKSILVLAACVFALVLAVFFHAKTGKYQIAAIGSVAGVYLLNTHSGQVSICSPVTEQGCMSIDEFRSFIEKRNQDAKDKVNGFVRDKKDGLMNSIKKFDFLESKEDSKSGP